MGINSKFLILSILKTIEKKCTFCDTFTSQLLPVLLIKLIMQKAQQISYSACKK